MNYDHVINAFDRLDRKQFHLSCGFCETTSFLFEEVGFYVVIHCKGEITFYTINGKKLKSIKVKGMNNGRECYMDVLITITEDEVIFLLPEYKWIDHYPHCDGESDRWDSVIVGIRDEIHYSKLTNKILN